MFLARHADTLGEEGWSPTTETLNGMGSMPKDAKKTTKPGEAERAAVPRTGEGRSGPWGGPDGLLKMITATVLQAALEEEMTAHLGHEKHHFTAAGQDGNVRNGTRPKTALQT